MIRAGGEFPKQWPKVKRLGWSTLAHEFLNRYAEDVRVAML